MLWSAYHVVVRSQAHLVGHDHEMTVAEGLQVVVRLPVLQPHDLFDGIDLCILRDLLVSCVSDVQELPPQREDAVAVAANNTQTADLFISMYKGEKSRNGRMYSRSLNISHQHSTTADEKLGVSFQKHLIVHLFDSLTPEALR